MKPRVSRSLRIAGISLVTIAMMPIWSVTSSAAERCAGSASSISLRGFPPQMSSQSPNFYYTPEGANGEFVIGGAIDQGSVPVEYWTDAGSPLPATPGEPPLVPPEDFDDLQHSFQFYNDGSETDCLAVSRVIEVPVLNDTAIDAGGVEELIVNINVTNASEGINSAPMYILDDDATTLRARMPEPTTKSIPEPLSASSSSVAKIPVLRSSGAGSVQYSISPSTDITSPATGTVSFTGGLGIISVSIEHDTVDEPNEAVTVTLTGSDGATVEGDNTFTLTIIDNDSGDGGGGGGGDDEPPVAVFHHPKHGARYDQTSFRANTIHLFVTERPVHRSNRIAAAYVGLRKKLRNGNCSWWKNGAWRSAGCSATQWFQVSNRTPYYTDNKDLFIYEAYPRLRPSVGTRIKNYTVFGKAIDTSGNVSRRVLRRNVNTFEVTR